MKETFVYVVECGDQGYVKIGMAGNPQKRLIEMQTGCPFLLLLSHHRRFLSREIARQVEFRAHKILSLEPFGRVQGEWFFCSPDKAITAIETATTIVKNRRGELAYFPVIKARVDLGARE